MTPIVAILIGAVIGLLIAVIVITIYFQSKFEKVHDLFELQSNKIDAVIRDEVRLNKICDSLMDKLGLTNLDFFLIGNCVLRDKHPIPIKDLPSRLKSLENHLGIQYVTEAKEGYEPIEKK